MERCPGHQECAALAAGTFVEPASQGQTVAFSARRAKHFRYSENAAVVQPLPQKYLSFRNLEVMI
jgi:hypothetical protein